MKDRSTVLALGMGILLLPIAVASGGDWPRFLGPEGNSMSDETGINRDWTRIPPKEIWRLTMQDEGFSGPAVVGDAVFVHDHVDTEDIIRVLDAHSGKERWHFAYAETGPENHGYTRATPTVADGFVYTVSRSGVVHCLEAGTGKRIWRADPVADHGGEAPEWGLANSAFLDGDRLITIAGGENNHVVALDKRTGQELWSGGGTDVAGYATPVKATLNGIDQYLIFTGESIIGVAADKGTRLWRHEWKTRLDSNACAPIVVDTDQIWIASGYRRGCALLQIKGDQVEEVWSDKRITPHWSSAVFHEGFLYTTTPPGYLVCVEAKTGQERWRSKGTARGFEHGGLCAVEGTLIVIEGNTGTVVQVVLSPTAYQELGRFSPFKSARCWVAPVVAHQRLYVRSPEALVCLDIAAP